MTPEAMKTRTKAFALRVIKLVEALPRSRVADVLGRQVLRSGTSVGANYRAACGAQSRRDFAKKIAIVEEEADETQYWLELIAESGLLRAARVGPVMEEAGELTAIATASLKTARGLRRR